ncbi:neuropeptide-like protein 30 [Macrobrachium rosenbergii]|uniref:neuropeptide-like protein 30 n=1 Tax=Macrobrachium rosenbergii TaxID=79674 RepID=UPI0034D750FB
MARSTLLVALMVVLVACLATAYPQFGNPGLGGGVGFGQPGFGGAGIGGSPYTNAFGGPCRYWNQDPITRRYFCTETPDKTFPGLF